MRHLDSMITTLVLGIAVAMGGCASTKSTEMLTPGVFALDCSGGAPNWDGCHRLAARACKGTGFEIQSQVSNAGSSGVGTNDWSTAGSQITRSMVVKCK